jgi:hypothetical protein
VERLRQTPNLTLHALLVFEDAGVKMQIAGKSCCQQLAMSDDSMIVSLRWTARAIVDRRRGLMTRPLGLGLWQHSFGRPIGSGRRRRTVGRSPFVNSIPAVSNALPPR